MTMQNITIEGIVALLLGYLWRCSDYKHSVIPASLVRVTAHFGFIIQ